MTFEKPLYQHCLATVHVRSLQSVPLLKRSHIPALTYEVFHLKTNGGGCLCCLGESGEFLQLCWVGRALVISSANMKRAGALILGEALASVSSQW